MEFHKFTHNYITDLEDAIQKLDWDPIRKATELIHSCTGTVWLIGNGGSASLASHMATDLQLAGKRAIALTDVAALSTYANDTSYEKAFAYQLNHLAKAGDTLVAISGSGKSPNIHCACIEAGYLGITTLGLFGHSGMYAPQVDLLLPVESKWMPVIQDIQQTILHIITYFLMKGTI